MAFKEMLTAAFLATSPPTEDPDATKKLSDARAQLDQLAQQQNDESEATNKTLEEAQKKFAEIQATYQTFYDKDISVIESFLRDLEDNEWITEHLSGNELGEYYHIRADVRAVFLKLDNRIIGNDQLYQKSRRDRERIHNQYIEVRKDLERAIKERSKDPFPDELAQRSSRMLLNRTVESLGACNYDFPETTATFHRAQENLKKALGGKKVETKIYYSESFDNPLLSITVETNVPGIAKAQEKRQFRIRYNALNQKIEIVPHDLAPKDMEDYFWSEANLLKVMNGEPLNKQLTL